MRSKSLGDPDTNLGSTPRPDPDIGQMDFSQIRVSFGASLRVDSDSQIKRQPANRLLPRVELLILGYERGAR
jgi:hypothetical protein